MRSVYYILCLAVLSLSLAFPVAAQDEHEVSGVVRSAEEGSTLPGANVLVKGTTRGTTTNQEGEYALNAPSPTDTLVFSFVGYLSQEIPIDGREEIDVALQTDVAGLEEMVVVGYGEQRVGDLTSAVTPISGEDITKRSTRNLASSLQGIAPGVTVWDLGGEPGDANINLRIRGVTTLGNNNPLVIVDGVEQAYNNIDPNDVESITVLEDASSTAIYGSRAANGVILIETKRGSGQGMQVNYTSRLDLQNLATVPEHLGTEEHLRLQNLAYENRGSDPLYSEEEIQKYVSGENRLEYPAPNRWFDILPNKNAPMMRNNLSVSYGGEVVNTYASAGMLYEEGMFPNRHSNTYNIRVNNDIYISENIDLQADVKLSRGDRVTTNPVGAGIYRYMLHATQWAVPVYPDGTYGLSPQRASPLVFADPDYAGTDDQTSYNAVGNFQASWSIVEGLKLSSRFSMDYDSYFRTRNWPRYEIRDYWNKDIVLRDRPVNSLSEEGNKSQQYTWNNRINYTFDVGNHGFDLMGGYSQEWFNLEYIHAEGRNLYNNDIFDLSYTESDGRSMTSSYEDWGLESFFSRMSYNYANRYLLQVNMRVDGSSRFPEGSRYTFFPSGSVGWRLSEESYLTPIQAIFDDLKLRASWGRTGNQNVGLYTYFDNLSLIQNAYVFNDNPRLGIMQNEVTSDDLTWETTTQTNIGVDFAVLNGLIEGSLDWYVKNTEGILLTLPITGVVGLNPAATNAGSVRNTGWGVELHHSNNISDINYSVSINLSDYQNEITDLAGTGPYFGNERNWEVRRVGSPIDAIWGYETDGYLSQEDIDGGYPTYASDSYPGDIKYVDRNGDGIINSDDKTVIGSSQPRYGYGLDIDGEWHGVGVNMQFQGVGKRDVGLVGALTEGGTWEGFVVEKAGDYWTPDNPDARFPRPQKQTLKNQQPSEHWVVDGSYLRLKNIQLGYSFPSHLIDQVGVRNLRLFIGGTNLWTLSALKDWGVDAEAPLGRYDYYPPAKTYTFGIDINL